MKIRIGVIGSLSSLEKISDILPQLKGACDFTLLPVADIEEVLIAYRDNHALYHGIIFGGSTGIREVMETDYPDPATPRYYIELSETDVYKGLLKLSSQTGALDFSRVMIDFIDEENNYYGLKDILPAQSFPQTCENISFAFQFNEIVETHISLWKAGRTDLSITHVGSIAARLKSEGIPVEFMYPSEDSILSQLRGIITEIQLFHMKENQSCYGYIGIEKAGAATEHEIRWILLYKTLLEYRREHPEFMIQKNEEIEIIISYGDLKRITENLTGCLLQNSLQKSLNFGVFIGWGIGSDLYQARLNARQAYTEACRHTPGNSFIITSDHDVIGPIGGDLCNSFSSDTDPDTELLSNALGITALQINKIRSILAKLRTSDLTSDILAHHLGFTIRTANRILKKLEEKGMAEVAYRRQEKLRGRPKKIYTIHPSFFSQGEHAGLPSDVSEVH